MSTESQNETKKADLQDPKPLQHRFDPFNKDSYWTDNYEQVSIQTCGLFRIFDNDCIPASI